MLEFEQGLDVVIPDGYTSIADDAFHGAQLTSVVIPGSITTIGEAAFEDNHLTSLVIPYGVTMIGEDAFNDNDLTNVVIPDSVAFIGENAFEDNRLTSVVLADSAEIHPDAFDPEVEIIRRPTESSLFKIENIQSHSHGLSLQLNNTPDMNVFRLYGGVNSNDQDPGLVLSSSSNEGVNLSAHWEDDTKQLHLLSHQVLEDGDYTLKIRADGLVSQSGDLLDGNGDGVDGHDYIHSFTHVTPDHFVSIGDTARSAGQDLSINGKDLKDGITGIPIHLSTTSSLQSFSGEISFNSDLLKDVSLAKGSDLPSDWVVNYSESSPGTLAFTVSGQSLAIGSIEDTLRLMGQVDANAADSYGSTSLIKATITNSSAGQISFKSDPGLMVNAYSGDTTGNGSHSSLDASRVQRVVVGLDSGFGAFDDINPVLIGDTTGNGSLSSLDASRIQQEVVGLPVDTFPSIPDV